MSILRDLSKELSDEQIRTDSEALAIYGKDWTHLEQPKPLAIVFPRSTAEVQSIVRLARRHIQALVPSGGRTGLSGGALAANQELVISFEQMNRILDFNEADMLVRVQAGVITEELQNFASEKGYYFPVDFASAGSSQIGGNIATNAGGIHVVRYGNFRQWVSGLQVVTGKAECLNLNEGLSKNATGFDLRHLFIGSEGCLGFITEAQIRLTRQPAEKTVFLFGLETWSKCLELFSFVQKRSTLSAFEVFTQACLERVMASQNLDAPFASTQAIYVLCEIEEAPEKLGELLDQIFDAELVTDGVQSQSAAQSQQIWAYRENISESLSPFKPYKNDISLLTSKIPGFIEELEKIIEKHYPQFEVLWFGHIGDGNLHINVLKPENMALPEFQSHCGKVSEILFSILKNFNGSVSAEHGVGLLKKDFLHYTKSEQEIQYMRSIKKIFDPDWILNPGKIFD